MANPECCLDPMNKCCGSLKILRICIVLSGILTVSLCAYDHFASAYTVKSLLPDHSKYFLGWEYIHLNLSSLNDTVTTPKNEMGGSENSLSTTTNFISSNLTTTENPTEDASPTQNPNLNSPTHAPNLISTTQNANSNSTNPHHERHAIADDAEKVMQLLPRYLDSGHEACRSFRTFIQELIEKLEGLGLNETELNKESIKNDYYELDVDHCPNILHERYFLGIAIVCLLLTTVVLAMSMIFCSTTMHDHLNKSTDITYHILSGVALLGGAGFVIIFLYRMHHLCNSSNIVLHKQFHAALLDFQMHWHKDPNSSLHISFDRHRAAKLHELNEELVPKYNKYLEEYNGHATKRRRNGAQAQGSKSGRVTDEMSKRKRKFSWTKKTDATQLPYSEFRCQKSMKFYWKIAAVLSGIMTAVFYIAAAVSILTATEGPEVETVLIFKEGNLTSKTKQSVWSHPGTNMDQYTPRPALSKFAHENYNVNDNFKVPSKNSSVHTKKVVSWHNNKKEE